MTPVVLTFIAVAGFAAAVAAGTTGGLATGAILALAVLR